MCSFPVTVLAFLIFSLLSICVQSSLYSEDDIVLDLSASNSSASNFTKHVYGKSNAWIIEFYKSWCGHCIKFAPTYKELARDTQTWKSVINVAAVDCNANENLDLCRQYEVQRVPSIKLFWHHTNENEPGKAFNNSRDIPTLESSMISFLESHWKEGVPPNWPQLLPIEEANWVDVFKSIPDGKQSVLVFVERPDSFVGRKVILDLSFQKDHVIRRLISSSALFKKLEIIQAKTPLPTLLKINRNLKEELVLSFSRDEKESNIRDRVFEHITGESRNKTKGIETTDKPVVETAVIDHVHMTDLENAVYYSLSQEVAGSKYIEGEKVSALKAYLSVLKRYFPGSKPVTGFLSKLHSWVSYRLQSLTGEDFGDKLVKMQNKNEYLPAMKEWVGCKGSTSKYRGYPCSLWTLFHTLTVQHSLRVNKTINNDGEVLFVIKDYVQHFFTCGDCSRHFLEMAKNVENEVNTSSEAVLWLWRAHNKVNQRLAGDETEDPVHPKIQFPSAEACPSCRQPKGEWDEPQVFMYLHGLYGTFSYSAGMGLQSLPLFIYLLVGSLLSRMSI